MTESGVKSTVRVVFVLRLESAAEMEVLPGEPAEASPEELICATPVADDAHVTSVVRFDVVPSE